MFGLEALAARRPDIDLEGLLPADIELGLDSE